MLKTRIVLPCFNEASRLRAPTFAEFLKSHPEASLLFVDDGSEDGTFEAMEAIREAAPEGSVSTLSLKRNSGKAEAVRQGVLKSMADGGVEAIGYLDADLSAPLEEMARLSSFLESNEADIALGSRVAILGCKIARSPVRHYLGRVFATCASLVLELPVYDTQCGAKVFRRCPELGKLFEKPFRSRWIFDVEILARLKVAGGYCGRPFPEGIVEVPLKSWEHRDASKVKPMDFFISLVELCAVGRALRMKLKGLGK